MSEPMPTNAQVSDDLPAPRRKKKVSSGMPPLPMTPMIDCTFQLLLFFVLVCEFRETEGTIPGTLPAKGNLVQVTDDKPPPDPIQVKVRPSAQGAAANFEMKGVATVITSEQELFDCLRDRQQKLGSADVPVVIYPSPDVPWEFVVKAFNQAVRARFTKIGFAQELG